MISRVSEPLDQKNQPHYEHRSIFTARKRSLGQGNMFTGVCLSTGGVPDQVHPPGADTPLSRHPQPSAEHAGRYGQRAGGTHPTGMQSCPFCMSSSFFRNVYLVMVAFTKYKNLYMGSYLLVVVDGWFNWSSQVWSVYFVPSLPQEAVGESRIGHLKVSLKCTLYNPPYLQSKLKVNFPWRT